MSMKLPLANILLVDDSHHDVMLTKILLERDKVTTNLVAVADGREAIAYIEHEPPFEGAEKPDLMLLDLNMPDMDGFEVLNELAEKGLIGEIPVVVCSGSDRDRDLNTARAFGIVDYLVKPVNYSKLAPVVAKIPTLRVATDSGRHFICRDN